jgi:hypothetical protein
VVLDYRCEMVAQYSLIEVPKRRTGLAHRERCLTRVGLPVRTDYLTFRKHRQGRFAMKPLRTLALGATLAAAATVASAQAPQFFSV